MIDYQKEYRENNKEQFTDYYKTYYENNKDKIIEQGKYQNLRKNNTSSLKIFSLRG